MEKISLILLAAGNSTRFGGNKLLYMVNGKPMYRHVTDLGVRLLEEGVIQSLILVSQYETIRQEVGVLPVYYIQNDSPEKGISHSIHLGIQEAENRTDCYVFAVCDQPYLTYDTLKGFIQGFVQSGKAAGTVTWQGEYYNPCAFRNILKDELMMLEGDRGGKKIIRKHESSLFLFPIHHKLEIIDIDQKGRKEV